MSVYERDRPDYADAAIRSMVEQSAPFTDLVIVWFLWSFWQGLYHIARSTTTYST